MTQEQKEAMNHARVLRRKGRHEFRAGRARSAASLVRCARLLMSEVKRGI